MTDRAPEDPATVEIVSAPSAEPRPWDRPSPPAPGSPAASTFGSSPTTAPAAPTTPAPSSPPAAKRARPRKSTRPGAAARAKGKGVLANSLVSLIADIDLEITKVNDLTRSIDQHVTALNKQRSEQQQRVRTLREMHAAVPGGTLGTYVEERLKELRTPSVTESNFPWPRKA
jgi:hypothetical protein